MTDTIAKWLQKGFIAGPFAKPPLKNFRVNPLMAVEQPGKIRPIMNLSSPKGRSFNEAVDMGVLRKLKMSTPKNFGETIMKMGGEGVMSKFDISDAYKLIRVRKNQWNKFGFKWLGKFFYDKTTVFGSRAAPEKFDSLPKTVVNISCILSKTKKTQIHRQLDDVPFVARKATGNAERFAHWYEKICKECRIPLAGFCPKKEKAFKMETEGTVLGIWFDAKNLIWKLPESKRDRIFEKIEWFKNNKVCRLKDVQALHGRLNNFAQMCEFMRGYRYNILALLRSFGGDEKITRLVPAQLRQDLNIWAKCVQSAVEGLPICDRAEHPPIARIEFATDAAGAAFSWKNGEGVNETKSGERGAASIRFEGEKVKCASVLYWPDYLMFEAKDKKGVNLGSKSAILEMVGAMLAVITEPKTIQNQHVVIYCDNLSVVNSWKKRYCKNDPLVSTLIRALHEVEAFLEADIRICHVKRRSTEMATLADNLTRKTTTTAEVLDRLRGARIVRPSGALQNWAEHPKVDWDLGKKLVQNIVNILYK